MRRIHIHDKGTILFYGNPAGYVKKMKAFVDPIFEKDELIEPEQEMGASKSIKGCPKME